MINLNSNCSNLFMKNLRIWKIGMPFQNIQANMYKKIEGIHFKYLIYNFNFDDCGTSVYNHVRTLYSTSTNPVNMQDDYNIYNINYSNSPVYNIPTNNLVLCETHQTKSNHEELCTSIITII
jgi:hypothetical protein